jgi:aminomuconate-semialdehyde/2-hydroxymuconate-6-semialdehyde dehydrogenase|tara:strand:- start:16438 stop:17880 length:1443 start_codon:yes stop_codon:yes gene_type:complete
MKIDNYIDGVFIKPSSGEYLDNIDPSTGKIYGQIPKSNYKDVADAIQSAKKAFPLWSKLTSADRSNHLMRVADRIEQRLEELALAESKDNGKPLKVARTVDIPRAVDNFRFFASAILHENSEIHDVGDNGFNYTLRRPVGVVACISPWNLPLYLFTWKIAPALAAGNTVVAKPSEITPATAFLLSTILDEVNFPKGVLNIIHGTGLEVGEPLVSHPDVPIISFTGGTVTGERINKIAASSFKKISLELGGKNPNVIFSDCDFEQMIKTTLKSSFSNQGQICLCGSRIIVEKSIYDRFLISFIAKTKKLRIGPPSDPTTQIGAIVSADHKEKILSYIKLAESEGGKIECGGESVVVDGDNSGGYYISPTIITGLDMNCRTNQEEIFGPVVTVMPFDSEDEALELANNSKYGLASTIWTNDLKKAHRVANNIYTGIVWVNSWLVRDLRTPFGGVKNSGVGREGGFESLQFFTEPKNIYIDLK